MSGKITKAPCGHAGEAIFGNFVRCLTPGCDGAESKLKRFGVSVDPGAGDTAAIVVFEITDGETVIVWYTTV